MITNYKTMFGRYIHKNSQCVRDTFDFVREIAIIALRGVAGKTYISDSIMYGACDQRYPDLL